MNPKIKTFDCVAESRKWRESASARLSAMSAEEELAYLHRLGERMRSQLRGKHTVANESLVVHEDPPAYGEKKGEK